MKVEIADHLANSKDEFIVPCASKQVKSCKYEKTAWPYILSAPLMWLLVGYVIIKKGCYRLLGLSQPKINTFFFDGLGKNSRKVKEYASSWKALDIVYNHPFPHNKDIGTLLDEFYWNGLNCQALRNRRKLIKQELKKAIIDISQSKKPVRILSLACGSGEVIIELAVEMKKKGIMIEALLIDIDENALVRAQKLIKEYGLEKEIKTEKNSVYDVDRISKGFRSDIIEMMGFIDYLNQVKAIELIKKIRGSLSEGGYLITCNIRGNLERYFLTWVINWPMIYRTPEQLGVIAEKSGFENYRLIYEPLEIHGIIIAKK